MFHEHIAKSASIVQTEFLHLRGFERLWDDHFFLVLTGKSKKKKKKKIQATAKQNKGQDFQRIGKHLLGTDYMSRGLPR